MDVFAKIDELRDGTGRCLCRYCGAVLISEYGDSIPVSALEAHFQACGRVPRERLTMTDRCQSKDCDNLPAPPDFFDPYGFYCEPCRKKALAADAKPLDRLSEP